MKNKKLEIQNDFSALVIEEEYKNPTKREVVKNTRPQLLQDIFIEGRRDFNAIECPVYRAD